MWQLLLSECSHSFQALFPWRRYHRKIYYRIVAWICWHIEGLFHHNGSNSRVLRDRTGNYKICERPTDKDKTDISVLPWKSFSLYELWKIFFLGIKLSQIIRNCWIWRRRVRCKKIIWRKKNRIFDKNWILKWLTAETFWYEWIMFESLRWK